MNPKVIRWSDKNIGRPICFVLTVVKKISHLFQRNVPHSQRVSKILFIKLLEQGSTVLAYPALKRAQELVGKKNVYIMVFRENRPILEILDLLYDDNVIEVDSTNLIKFIYSLIKAMIRIRKEEIDACLDMEFFSRTSAILSYLSGADKRVGLHRFNCEGPYRGNLFTHRLIYNPYLHTKILFLSLVEALNHPPPVEERPMIFEVPDINNEIMTFLPAEEEKAALSKKIETIKKSSLGHPIVILSPNTEDLLPLRRWPKKNFINLARAILKDFPGASIIITGSLEEKDKSDEIAAQIPQAVSLTGHTSLRELFVLYCISDLLITSDSGPAHFSSLTPIKSVVLFGPETSFLYGPLSQKSCSVNSSLVCSPCLNVYNAKQPVCACGACLKNIKVEDVYKQVKYLLENEVCPDF